MMNAKALENLQLEENKQLCKVLVSSEDKGDVAHKVIHKLEFISEYKKVDLLQELEEMGFTINKIFVTEEGYNGLMFQREDKVDLETMDALTLEMILLLDEHDARYGGWTTEVIK